MNVAIHGTNPTNGAQIIQIITTRPDETSPLRRVCAWITAISRLNDDLEFRCYEVDTTETRLASREISRRYP